MLSRKVILSLAAVVLVLAAGGYYYKRIHRSYNAETTSKSVTAQPSYSTGPNRPVGQSNGNDQGGAVDTGGADAPKDTVGITSASGLITVTTPANNDVLSDGTVLAGTTKGVDQVQYRLVDNQVGVIAQGSLTVVNGQFSGKLQFKPHAASGRLDVFSFTNLSEEVNSIEIPVGFKE